jgi:uncharacterized damage-inducible protein DinB
MVMSVESRFLERSRYYLGVEYPAKIRAALLAMPPGRVWWRPNEGSNSVGNLVLHLAGNVTQWIVGGVGGEAGERDRDGEFGARGGLETPGLVALLEQAVARADGVLAHLPPESLLEERNIQGRRTTVLAAIYHVVEHFSTHTGQIVLLAKMFADDGTIRFYDDARDAAPLFLGKGRRDID